MNGSIEKENARMKEMSSDDGIISVDVFHLMVSYQD